MVNPYDKHQFAKQPIYHENAAKKQSRFQIMEAFKKITGLNAIPEDRQYWTLCNWQPDVAGSEIVQLVDANFLKKEQFFGIDYDMKKEGIIEHNKKCHPNANWFDGDFLETIEENYDLFKPALINLDGTQTVLKTNCHIYVARIMNICPEGTVFAVNLMLSDAHSSRKFSPKILVEGVRKKLYRPNDWQVLESYYPYKSSRTDMGTYVFVRN